MGNIGKKFCGFFYGHIKDIGDIFPLEPDFQGFLVEPFPLADIAHHVYVGKKVHLDFDRPVPLAVFASSAPHVEGKTARLVSPGFGVRKGGEEIPDAGEDAHVGGGIRPGGPADRTLVYIDHLVQVLDPFEGLVGAFAMGAP